MSMRRKIRIRRRLQAIAKQTGYRLRRARLEADFSQQMLATAVGVHINTVARWELDGISITHPKIPLIIGTLSAVRL